LVNCETRLSRPFSGPGGHFRQSYDEKAPKKEPAAAESMKKYDWTNQDADAPAAQARRKPDRHR
jgi:hypothetical protein